MKYLSWRNWVIFTGLLFLGTTAATTNAAEVQTGKSYAVVSPTMPVETGKKIEVLELFWYGCPHCFDLEPDLEQWVKTLPKDVEFRRMPAPLRNSWVPMAKAYYAEEALGVTDKLHADIFNAIHLQGLNLNDENVLADFVAKEGVDSKKFMAAYNSFGVRSEVESARTKVLAYGAMGVPTLIVDGKYRTDNELSGGGKKLFQVLDQLIKKARAERAVKR
jgi:thiol:disulfide interchange protein DsbA